MAGSKTMPKLPMADPNDLVIIGLDTQDGEDHELYDERAMNVLDENLVKNIMVYGVLQPITVREQAGKLLVVDGRQRVRAARKAKSMQSEGGEVEIKVPYTTHGVIGADRQRLTGVMVSANEQRTADEILVKAAKAARMHALGASLDEVAIAFGRSKTTIRQWLKLLESHPTLQEAVRHETVALSAAHEIAKYGQDEQVKVLRELQAQAKGARVTESMAKAYRQQQGDSTATAKGKASATKATATTKANAKQQAKATAASNKRKGNPNLSPEALKLLDAADAQAADSTPPTPAPAPKGGTKAQPRQAGIKRTWLRDALKTERAKKLTDEQRGVLTWMATGLSVKGSWYDEFQFDAEAEMEDAKKAGK
jgi:hypothetical protein